MVETFATVYADAIDEMFTRFGASGTYTPDGKPSQSITAILKDKRTEEIEGEDLVRQVNMATLKVKTSDVSDPGMRDKWNDGTTTWIATEILSNGNGVAVLAVRELEITEKVDRIRNLDPVG